MKAVIFAGPTISSSQISSLIDAEILPPVSMGDVRHAVSNGARVIGVIDGYFEGVPSVWHKEILWAIDQSITVFGSSSMGALRAAELHEFGMRGIGRIFDAYKSGELEDDDEVAVHHGPMETGYLTLSEPMVNIRATLDRAIEQTIIDKVAAQHLISLAKEMFYPERSWDTLLENADGKHLTSRASRALSDWLPDGKVDQKRDDAIAMISAMNEHLSHEEQSTRPYFDLEWTVMWDQAIGTDNWNKTIESPPSIDDLILDQLRLDPRQFQAIRRQAAARLLAAHATRVRVPEDNAQAITQFRTSHKLFSKNALDAWLEDNDIGEEEMKTLIRDEARLSAFMSDSTTALNEQILHELRLSGQYRDLTAQARTILQNCQRHGTVAPDVSDLDIGPIELKVWYFEQLLRIPVPENLEQYIEDMGFDSIEAFERTMTRQYLNA